MSELPYPLGRGCCGAPDATACHQRGLCWMEGVHPESPGYVNRPAAPVVQPADQPAPDTTAGDALREAIAGGLRAVAHWCQHDPCTPCLIISDEEFDAQIEVTAMHGSTPTRIEGKPEAIADALLSGPLAQLHADAAELRAKVQRVEALAERYERTSRHRRTLAEKWQEQGRWQLAGAFRNLARQSYAAADRIHNALNGDQS